jgi:hypothetical protein
MSNKEQIEEDESSIDNKHLIPELENSDWEVEHVEVAADEHPQEMEWKYIVESYEFTYPETDIRLVCNVEASKNQSAERKYDMYLYVGYELHFIQSFETRRKWWSGIRKTMREEIQEGEKE